MQYKYVKEQSNYSDFSSGKVLYSLPGYPAFPVRLASEIFQRCQAYRNTIYGDSSPSTLYDPCCGAAYHLCVVAYLHYEHLNAVIASDIDEKAVTLAERNLRLLTVKGLNDRIREISAMLGEFGKESHREALRSALALKERLSAAQETHPLQTRVFQANAMDGRTILKEVREKSVDIVLSDVPYGRHSKWEAVDPDTTSNPSVSMLDAIVKVISPSGIVAIVSGKDQKIMHSGFRRLEQFQVGKRRVVLLTPEGTAKQK